MGSIGCRTYTVEHVCVEQGKQHTDTQQVCEA